MANVPSLFRAGVACAAQTCLVAWTANDGVYALRLDAQLAALDAMPVLLGSGNNGFSTATAVASNGTDFLIATRVTASLDGGPMSSQLVTARVTAGGATTPLRPLPLPAAYGVSLAGGGGRYVVAGATNYNGPYVALRLDALGAAVDATPFTFTTLGGAGYAYWPLVAATSTDFWVVWHESGTPGVSRGARLPLTGAAGTPAPQALGTGAVSRRLDLVAGAGAGLWTVAALSVPTANTENQPTLFRFDAAGTSLDPAGAPLRLVPDTQDAPAVAWGGGCYLAAWESNRGTPYLKQIWARRFDAAGQPLDAPFLVAGAAATQESPSVASDGANFLVAWSERGAAPTAVRAARVSAQGMVLDPAGLAVSPAGVLAAQARVAFAGGSYGVVWTRLMAVTNDAQDIFLQRLSPAGAVLDATPIGVMVDVGSAQQDPAIFSSGAQFLVTWRDSRPSTLSPQLYGTRVSAAGAVLDTPSLNVSGRTSIGSTGQSDYAPSAAFALGQWFLVYNTDTSQEAASRVSSSGAVLEARRTLTFNGGADLASPSATAFDGQRFRYLWDDMNSFARHARAGWWDTSVDAGPQPAVAWSDTMDSVSLAQSAPDSALLVSSAALLPGLPLLERGWRRVVRFCAPGAACSAPALADDAGTPFDAGVADAGAADAGAPDGGGLEDAGLPDAGEDEACPTQATTPAWRTPGAARQTRALTPARPGRAAAAPARRAPSRCSPSCCCAGGGGRSAVLRASACRCLARTGRGRRCRTPRRPRRCRSRARPRTRRRRDRS